MQMAQCASLIAPYKIYESRADARGDADDETARCARCGREFDNCGIGNAGRSASRLCVLSRLWRTPAGGQLLLVPPAPLRRFRQHGRLARTSRGILLLVVRLPSLADALTAHSGRSPP